MTNSDTAPGTETWEKRAVPYGTHTYWNVVCDSRYVAQSLSEADCDQIIADHNAAAKADAYRAALEAAKGNVEYALEGFDGHEFNEWGAAQGMDMGCITCCQINALRSVLAALTPNTERVEK